MGKGVVFVLSGIVLLICGVISDCSGASKVGATSSRDVHAQ